MPLLTTAAAALIGALLFEGLKVPAGALLGAVVGVALLNTVGSLGPASELPDAARFLAYAGLGWLVGQGVTRTTVTELRERLGLISIVVVVLVLVGLALGWALAHFGAMDPRTAYLAASPGALSQMSAVAASLDANVTTVMTVHTIRVVALILLSPLIGRLAAG